MRQIETARTFAACRAEGETLAEHAEMSGEPAQYLASARLLEGCERALGPDATAVDPTIRMQTYALAVQNYAIGGDLQAARTHLKMFEKAFSDQDLYYPDGTSFRDTMGLVLGLEAGAEHGALATTNVHRTLKAELRRVDQWAHQ